MPHSPSLDIIKGGRAVGDPVARITLHGQELWWTGGEVVRRWGGEVVRLGRRSGDGVVKRCGRVGCWSYLDELGGLWRAHVVLVDGGFEAAELIKIIRIARRIVHDQLVL